MVDRIGDYGNLPNPGKVNTNISMPPREVTGATQGRGCRGCKSPFGSEVGVWGGGGLLG